MPLWQAGNGSHQAILDRVPESPLGTSLHRVEMLGCGSGEDDRLAGVKASPSNRGNSMEGFEEGHHGLQRL